jgi:transmembrane sensor
VFAGSRRFEVIEDDARFNLRKLTREQVDLTVVQGQVHAHNARMGSLSPAQLRARLKSGAYTFGASEGGTVGPGWQSPWSLPAREIERRVAWQSGRIDLDNEYLEDALQEVHRYTPVKFEIAQQELHALRVKATFKVGDIEAVRRYLRDQLRIDSTQREDGTIVLTRMTDRTPAGTAKIPVDCMSNYSCRRLGDTINVRF